MALKMIGIFLGFRDSFYHSITFNNSKDGAHYNARRTVQAPPPHSIHTPVPTNHPEFTHLSFFAGAQFALPLPAGDHQGRPYRHSAKGRISYRKAMPFGKAV